jgi:hypothetical protein
MVILLCLVGLVSRIKISKVTEAHICESHTHPQYHRF